jgi:hypothetical protein
MAEQQTDNTEWKKKCAETGKSLKRVRRYYRNGRYFLNKAAFKAYLKKQQEAAAETAKEKAAQKETAKVKAAEAAKAQKAPDDKSSEEKA